MKAAPDVRRRLVIVMASTSYSGHQLYDQRLSRALVGEVDVLYVEPPRPIVGKGLSVLRGASWKGRTESGVQVRPTWTVPYGQRSFLAPVTAVLIVVQVLVELARRRTRPSGAVVIACHPWVTRTLRWIPTVMLVKDDYVAGAHLIGLSARQLTAHRARNARAVDHVVVVSPVLADVMSALDVQSHVVPAGVDPPVPKRPLPLDLRAVPLPRAVFIGLMSDRIDFSLLSAVVERGVNVVAVGSVQGTFTKRDQLAGLITSGLFHQLSQRGQEEVQAVVQHCDVGLIPYVDDEFNRASFPLKTLEYLAAGKQVVATDLPALAWLGCQDVLVAGSPDEFAADVVDACARAGDATIADRCASYTVDHGWDSRAKAFLQLLATTSTGRSGPAKRRKASTDEQETT